ncbi:MAG: phosphodiester glycosidase family protein, partial [Muribaculaceae bacterium]
MTKSNFKKTMLLTMLLSLIIPIVKSKNGITRTVIDGATYIVDTLTHYKTGPGTTFTEMRFSGETNNLVFKSFFIMSQVENNPNIKFRAETANDSIAGLKTITEHIKTRTKPGEYYIAGVNGDLQPAGVKNWGCNQNGVYATPPPPGLGHLVITNERTPWSTSLGNVLSMTLHGNTIKLDHINDERFTNELVVYNSMNGNYTHTQGGKEIAFELLGGESWKINSPVKGRITGETSDIGNMKIPKNGGVISASGTAITKIESLKEGDIIEVSIRQDLKYYGDITPNITQSIGAFHAIVRDGKAVYIADLARHPRTLVGYSKDKKHLIMCIVDGRQTASAGVTYPEMSDLMIYAGAYGA